MKAESPQTLQSRRIPTWVLALLPLAAVVISNADVVLLAVLYPRADTGNVAIALATTIPLSFGAGGLTLWFILRLRREVDRRSLAEQEVRATLADLSRALDREHLLRRELDHRVRNNLSALLALIGIYEDADQASKDIVASLRGKILALRESYCLIAESHGEGIELRDLLVSVVSAVLGRKDLTGISIAGPSVRLTSREANAFAMIVQELLTNAGKHGALRQGGGTIGITWESAVQADRARVSLHWTEQPVADIYEARTNGHSGVGLSLIDGFAACDLRGSVSCQRSADQWNVDLVANLKIPSASASSIPPPKEVPA